MSQIRYRISHWILFFFHRFSNFIACQHMVSKFK